MSTPRHINPRLRLRERIHKKLDELLDRYEEGDELWLDAWVSWTSGEHSDEIRMVIREPHP